MSNGFSHQAFFLLLTFAVLCGRTKVAAQENIPIGTWRTHLSFTSVKHVTTGDSKVFAASQNGVMVYDLVENSFETYSTLNALSSTNITALAFDEDRKQLLVAYATGAIDLVSEEATIQFTRLVNPADVSVAGTVNHILINGSIAYLSTNYGVVVFDLSRNEVRETWRNLGETGQLLAVHQTALLNGRIYLATSKGVLEGDLADNLLDFSQWSRFSTGIFNTTVKRISIYKEQVFAAIEAQGLFFFNGSSWLQEASYPVLSSYTFLQGNEELLLVGGDQLFYMVNSVGEVMQVNDPLIQHPVSAVVIDNIYWVADQITGLLSNSDGTWKRHLPNGPSSPIIAGTRFTNNAIHAIHGGLEDDFFTSNSSKFVSKFAAGLWTSSATQVDYSTDIESDAQGSLFVASFGEGLEKRSVDGSSTILNNTNSPLRYVTSLAKSTSGLWIANYGATQSLHLLSAADALQSFSFPFTYSRYPFKIAVDGSENVWMLVAPAGGGGVFIVKRDGTALRYLTDQPGGGLLPNEEVLSLAIDKNDYVWIGTAEGVAYYTFAGDDGIRPIVEGRFLLSEERVTALAVDEGNRKWMGTERGVWLFNATGDEVIHNFTAENSPLPSNVIRDIEIEKLSGEVFITTDKGLISFRSDATETNVHFGEAKIFPNPVTPEFAGWIGISNLYENSIVKITDVSGKLINQLQANGGTASWNALDHTGKRVPTGVYLVIASAQDGSESVAGKIIVVD